MLANFHKCNDGVTNNAGLKMREKENCSGEKCNKGKCGKKNTRTVVTWLML